MKMTRKLIGAGLVSIMSMGFAASAQADMTSGFYVGLNAGGVIGGETDWTYTTIGTTPPALDVSGSAFGIHGGYNMNTKVGDTKLVYGVELDYSKTNMDDSGLDGDSFTGTVEIDYLASVRARLGAEYQNTMLYLTVGYGMADITVSTALGATVWSDDKRVDGWVFGFGAEHAFSKNLSARLELMVYELDDDLYATDVPVNAEAKPTVGRVGITYAF